MTRRKHLEDDMHMTVAQFLDVALPPDAAWTTVEHGGKRTKTEAGKLKAKGVRPGWPDIEIIWLARAHFIELKAPSGRLSVSQKDCHAALYKAGALVAMCQSIEEVEGTLRGWGFALRATTGTRAA